MPKKTSITEKAKQLEGRRTQACRDMVRCMERQEAQLTQMASDSKRCREAFGQADAALDQFIASQFRK